MSKLFIISTKGRVGTLDLTRKISDKLQSSGIEVSSMNFSGQFDEGKLSVTSPIAKGLLGLKVRDMAEIKIPAGVLKYKVLKITR